MHITRFSAFFHVFAAICVGLCGIPSLQAQPPRVLKKGELPDDDRLGELKTLNGHFPFVVPDNAGAWHTRAEALKRKVLVSTGLWPMPTKPPLNAVIYGKSLRNGFSVEKVYFESLPGHFVTGLLFRPENPSVTPGPAVLSPHGHGGRMQRHSDEEIERQIAQGAEHFKNSGQTPKLARCVQLARMGCVTFIFDMLGYADSMQITREIAHRHKDARPEEAAGHPDGWVFYSPEADLRLQSIMGLQTWNLIRSLDFLASLPDVDPERLAVTGGSGGGTQSILLGAIDPRIKVSFPNGMVSTSMQGGCYCENCNLLRVGTGNVELAALFAPKPQAMTAADDWTKDMMKDGYPELKWLYAMIGNESDVYCRPMLHFKHNYNYVTRATMYQWMNRHLELGLDDPVIEQDFQPLTDEETVVWNEQHPAPAETGIPHERNVCRWLDQQAQEKLVAIRPQDEKSLTKYREVIGGAWQAIIEPNASTDLTYKTVGQEQHGQFQIIKGLLRDPNLGSQLPVLTVHQSGKRPSSMVIWSSMGGKADAFDQQGAPSTLLSQLVHGGAAVILPDLLYQGEYLQEQHESDEQRLIDDPRSYSAFTFGYNRTLVASRCNDLLSILQYVSDQHDDTPIHLLGTADTAAWVAPTAALAGGAIANVVLDVNKFRYANATSYRDSGFVPGAVKYGDVQGVLALRAPHPITLIGESNADIVQMAYAAANAKDALALSDDRTVESVTQRLLKPAQ